jgi:AbiJ N-terminal domain 3
VAELNKVLARDGYQLAPEGEESGYPIFAFRSLVRRVAGRPKNLIFASRGAKPEIGFADALNNDIVILSGEDSCLIYDLSIGSNGLLWSDLVKWWGDLVPAAGLSARLQEALASDTERRHFVTYFKTYRSALGDGLPALLPQVYLHCDPAIVKTLRHRLPLPPTHGLSPATSGSAAHRHRG